MFLEMAMIILNVVCSVYVTYRFVSLQDQLTDLKKQLLDCKENKS
jgi:hypothetical protein